MSSDISLLLNEWEYDPENSVRLVPAADGRQIMQVRLPLGIEQYELDGRPDGFRPFSRDTVLDEIKDRLRLHVAEHHDDGGFTIEHDDFALLQNESILYYYRYLLLFQIGDYARTARDTGHNLEVCGMVEKYCADKDDRKSLLQYRPYIVRVNALARSMIALNKGDKAGAEAILGNAVEAVAVLQEVDTPVFQFERIRSLNHLKATLKELKDQQVTEVDTLEKELKDAIEEENYERAAEIRDAISKLRSVSE